MNAHILALEARLHEVGAHLRAPDLHLIGLFCECGCMETVSTTSAKYEEDGGVWSEGHKPD